MVKQAVKVVVRTRPTANFASQNIEINAPTNNIIFTIPKQLDKGVINNQQESWKFKFDKIMHNASQEDVYDACGRDIVASVLDGYNGTILCYGQTGAGKTFTMTGSSSNYKYRGMIPRAISQIFQEIGARYEQAVTVKVSYVEIYNELMFDLLSPIATDQQNGNDINIQDDMKNGIHVKGLTMHICTNEEEALNCLFEGDTNRTVSPHELNKTSSRSHCIFTFYIESKSRVESSEKIAFSKLNLVDLAGSERTKKTGSEGITMKEAQFINKSLSFLEQVVVALCEQKREHIPYRQSKLTYLLKSSIGGNCKTLMIANVWPEQPYIEETLSTLRFATRMMSVSNEAVVNVQLDSGLLIKKYEKEIKELKQELAMHDTLADRGIVNYDPYSPEQQFEIQKVAEQYLEGTVDEIQEITSLRQVRELFIQFKNLYKKMQAKIKAIPQESKEKEIVKAEESKKVEKAEVKGVGDEEETAGFGVGKAPKDAKPTQSIDFKGKKEEEPEEEEAKEEQESKQQQLEASIAKPSSPEALDKQTAYSKYKLTEGKATEEGIKSNLEDLHKKKEEAKVLAITINNAKKEIDKYKELLEKKKEQKATEQADSDIIDEEEFSYLKEIKNHKKVYRAEFDKLKDLKGAMFHIQNNIAQLKQQLLNGFESWYIKKYGDTPTSPNESPILNKSQRTVLSPEEEVDQDAMTYIKAKQKVNTIHKAKKMDKLKHNK